MFILNKKRIIQRTGDIPNIVEILAVIFIDEVDNYIEALQQALTTKDSKVLCHQAHTIKGALATFADNKGVKLAIQLEKQVEQQGINQGTQVRVQALQHRLYEVAQVLNKEVM